MGERFTCAICISFTSETPHDYFVSTRGGHIFHYSCIKSIIETEEYPLCPVCREPVSFATLTRLYGIEAPTEDFSRVEPDHFFKVVVLGDSGVGKSALLRRFAEDAFDTSMVTTVGCDLLNKQLTMGNTIVRLNLWDTAGDEKYRSIIPSYVRNAHAILMCYSTSDASSFLHMEDWIKFANDYAPENAVRVLIGNKADQKEQRMVTTAQGKEFGNRYGLSFFETSAKDSFNIEAAMRTATAEILEKPDLVEDADAQRSRSRKKLRPPPQQGYCASDCQPTSFPCCT